MIITTRVRIRHGKDSYCAKTVGRSRLNRHIEVSVARVMTRISRRSCQDIDWHLRQPGARYITG